MTAHNRLPLDPEKRRSILPARLSWLASMTEKDPRHAALFCPHHANYIGNEGVFPCQDCEDPE